ncbi:hypothetical protein L2E82_35425 [Cichorium intybus]|uniref:Uncharacterized protein n=1 Tax=Cichorium intybus TaxID=13427 RepID=A0ACB9BNW2_CICIN|nr:hypothetical protein L2E82_35425 [Cichorium intybus]
MLSRMLKYRLERRNIEQRVTFLNDLHSKWKVVVSTVTAHEQFKTYTLAKLVGILKSHEDEVTKEYKLVTSMGSLALVAKGKKAIEEDDEDGAVEVWSTDSKDEETSASFFAAKLVSEQVKECETVVNKMKEDEIDADCYKCETIVSSDDVFDSYRVGLEKIEKISLNVSEFDESEMSEISVEDEIDCSVFTKENEEPKKRLISENSIEFVRIVENKGSNVLNEQATVFHKVKTVPNQLFVETGLDIKHTSELTVLVNNDSADGCDALFWSEPVDNEDEMKGLSEMTSTWKSKGKYISKPLNRIDFFSQ